MISFANYKFVKELYKNKETIVFKAVCNSDEKFVILKTSTKNNSDQHFIAKLKHEYEITKDIGIDGVIKSYNLERCDNRTVLVIECFGNSNLKNIIPENGFELKEFLPLAIQIVETLGQIHKKHIIHKDIKPANIIVNTKTMQVKITDFHISSLFSREYQKVISPNAISGTLQYIAPEQTGRMNRAIDYRSDFYNTGISFYEMLTGIRPFESKDPMELIHYHIARRPVPPDQLNNNIPKVVSDIIMTLLSKTAEERYQSASGLKYDLERVFDRVKTDQQIESFSLRKNDIADNLQISQKLYGREDEIQTLMTAFERVSIGVSEAIMVTGSSGLGKSSLVNEIHKPIVKQKGFFISGKFDQYKRNTPYACLIQAFSDLVRQILTGTDEEIKKWIEKLLDALGSKANVIIEVIPELELLIGKQPAVDKLEPVEAQNRFNLIFRRFVAAFARKEHPLVLFLDDLQWIDAASLKLMQIFLSNSQEQHLLFIGAYRSNEVNKSHRLVCAMEEMKKDEVNINYISLSPLPLNEVTQLVSDSLACPKESSSPLAELIYNKTAGNPFFLNEFLLYVYKEGVLGFDFNARCWKWDIDQISKMRVTDNVIDLMLDKIKKLPSNACDVLKYAACIGNTFDLKTLSILTNMNLTTMVESLGLVIQEGLVIDDSGLRMEELKILNDDKLKTVTFMFVHDRIQQASYLLIDDDHKEEIHLQTGRLILENLNPDEIDKEIFNIVSHLNYAKTLINDKREKRRVVKFNLSAGIKAKSASAYESALSYFANGIDMLESNCWKDDYELTSSLFIERAETEYFLNNLDTAEKMFDEIENRLTTVRHKLDICEKRIKLYTNQGKYGKAVTTGIEGLKMFGVTVNTKPGMLSILTEYLKFQLVLFKKKCNGKKNIKNIYDLPVMTNQDKIYAMKILKHLQESAYFYNINLLVVLSIKMAKLSVKYGNVDSSSFGYCLYSNVIMGAFGHIETGYELGKTAIKLNDKFNSIKTSQKSLFAYHTFITHWKNHLKHDIDSMEESFHCCNENGDLLYACYTISVLILKKAVKGDHLDDLIEKSRNHLEYIYRINERNAELYNEIVLNMALCLKGETKGLTCFDTNEFNEDAKVKRMIDEDDTLSLHVFYVFKIKVACIIGDYETALQLAEKAEKIKENSLGQIHLAEHFFYQSLVLAANYLNVYGRERKKFKKLLVRNVKKLKKWSEHCPENFLNRYLLASAEFARITGKHAKAFSLYEKAIEAARNDEFIHIEAIANELAGRLYIKTGRKQIAEVYIKNSCYCYENWGAVTKVKILREEFPGFFFSDLSKRGGHSKNVLTNTLSSTTSSKSLDIGTIIKASQAISGEIVIDKLLIKMINILIENAGAQRGVLIMVKDERLVVVADGVIVDKNVSLKDNIPVEDYNSISLPVVQYVARSLDNIVLEDAVNSGMFTEDNYIKESQIKSILCMPILNQGQLTGELYLENKLSKSAFTHERIELLEILSSQVSVSLKNAGFYSELEQKVKDRTKEIETANNELQSAYRDLEKLEQAKTSFVSSVSHEIKNPLTSIIGYANITRKEYKKYISPIIPMNDKELVEISESIDESLKIIVDEGERLTRLTNNVLDIAKIESGKTEWKIEEVNIIEICKQALLVISAYPKSEKTELVFNPVPDNGKTVKGNFDRLIQVITNLLNNALKFTTEGNVTLNVEFLETNVLVSISDTGTGIRKEEMSEIFKQFKQVSNKNINKNSPHGTGLGLPICKEIVEHLGGKIWTDSELGKGSVFYFTLNY